MNNKEDLSSRARAFCIRAHAGQTREGGEPYHTHPEAVADLLRGEGVEDAEILAAAYLHDVVEDTSVTIEELEREFGGRVASLVEEMTNPDYPGRTFEEKHRQLREHALHMSDEARLIKLADRLHNLSEIHHRPPDGRRRYAEVTADLLAALRPWPSQRLAKQIEQAIQPYLRGTGSTSEGAS